jgi:hypothetical protein
MCWEDVHDNIHMDTETEIVASELFIAFCALMQFGLSSWVWSQQPEGWMIAAGVAVASSAVFVVADRTRRGMVLLLVSGVVLVAGIVVNLVVEAVPIGVLPWVVLGFGGAMGLNRLVFGVVRPIPSYRLSRQDANATLS